MYKHKITNSKNLYRPKKHSPHTYNRFMRQFRDLATWGIGNKQHLYSKIYINSIIIAKNPCKYGRVLTSLSMQKNHLSGKKILYYTNHPHSHIGLFCLDIDLKQNTTPKDIVKVKNFLLFLFPNCYSEPSSSGLGLHFYILISFENTSMVSQYPDWGNRGNTYLQNDILSLGKVLRRYINHHYNVKFDALKSSYSNYKFDTSHRLFLLDNCGVLCKQPRPSSRNADILYQMPVYHVHQIFGDILPVLTKSLYRSNLVTIEEVNQSRIYSPSKDMLDYQEPKKEVV